MTEYQFPLTDGYVNNPFKPGSHYGFDMIRNNPSLTLGSPLLAVTGGKVTASGVGVVMGYDYGNWIEYLSTDGQYIFQAHARNSFTQGDNATIIRGSQLNQVGATGNVTGPHVHTAFMSKHLDKATSYDGVPYITERLASLDPAGDSGTVVSDITEEDIVTELVWYVNANSTDGKVLADTVYYQRSTGDALIALGVPATSSEYAQLVQKLMTVPSQPVGYLYTPISGDGIQALISLRGLVSSYAPTFGTVDLSEVTGGITALATAFGTNTSALQTSIQGVPAATVKARAQPSVTVESRPPVS